MDLEIDILINTSNIPIYIYDPVIYINTPCISFYLKISQKNHHPWI